MRQFANPTLERVGYSQISLREMAEADKRLPLQSALS
jgi:hypothetical protein